MTDITHLKRMLADRAQVVAEMLLPSGRKEGGEWRAGSVGGEKGRSLGVHLTGQKAGVWRDFATSEGGDLLDLWCIVKRLTLAQALEEARVFLGIQRREPYRDPKPAYVRPPKPRCVKPEARVLDYLREERNIPREVLDRYKIGEDGDRIVFPFLLPDGTLALVKTREAVDGAAPKPTAANCEPVLFGWQAIPDDTREVVLTEGEIDTLSMSPYGFPALSLPFGGGGGRKQQWIENEFERLQRFEKIFIATDMDKPGDEAAAEIASRLGRHRCFRVKLPRKDANQCLVDGVPKQEIAECIRKAESLDPEGLRVAGAFADKVVRPVLAGRRRAHRLFAAVHGPLWQATVSSWRDHPVVGLKRQRQIATHLRLRAKMDSGGEPGVRGIIGDEAGMDSQANGQADRRDGPAKRAVHQGYPQLPRRGAAALREGRQVEHRYADRDLRLCSRQVRM